MNTIKPHRFHPIWNIIVFIWVAAASAGIGVLQRKDLTLWLMLGIAAVGLCILAVLCVKFIPAQGCDIFIMTEESVPKRKICMRFIIEFSIVILIAVIAGTLIGFLTVPESSVRITEAQGKQEMTENRKGMNFGNFSDMPEMPEGTGENGFSFPENGNTADRSEEGSFDFSSGNPFGSSAFPAEDTSSETTENADNPTQQPSDRMPPSGYSRENTDSSETSERQNMQRPQNSEMIQNPEAPDTDSQSGASLAAADTVSYFSTMGLLAVLYISVAAVSLAVSINRYNPYDDWEWKYEYAD